MLAIMDRVRMLSIGVNPRDLTGSGLKFKPLVQQIEPQTARVIDRRWRKLPGTRRDQIVTNSSHVLSIPVTYSQIYAGPVRVCY